MIIILNLGSQFAYLIARRVRDLGVKAEILPFDTAVPIKGLDPFRCFIREAFFKNEICNV
jgi:GMP synthase-like glutamine amidotransferase